MPATRTVADILATALHANPTLQLGIDPWPVHRIGPAFQPDTPDATPTCLAVYRDQYDTLRFARLNPLSAHLLQLLQAALQQLASAAGMCAEHLLPFACDLLQQWLDEQQLHAPDRSANAPGSCIPLPALCHMPVTKPWHHNDDGIYIHLSVTIAMPLAFTRDIQ